MYVRPEAKGGSKWSPIPLIVVQHLEDIEKQIQEDHKGKVNERGQLPQEGKGR